jgi:hypothetical protein
MSVKSRRPPVELSGPGRKSLAGLRPVGRLGGVLIVLASVTFAACTTSPAEPNPLTGHLSPSPKALDAGGAIRAVLVAAGFADTSQTFPNEPGQAACVIQGGGPYPGIRVPGTCQTSVVMNGSVLFVTLTEHWDATAFHGGDVDPSHGQLSHSWRYMVDGEGKVTFVDGSGNFPPQQVM